MMTRGRPVTVTEIATALGFVELGRFSVEYRERSGRALRKRCVRRSVNMAAATED